jgi:uncharacterized protein (DUF2147 family)
VVEVAAAHFGRLSPLVTLGLAALLASACGGGSAQPINGYWSFKGGVIQVRAEGPGFSGTVVRQPQSGDCAEPIGYVLLKLSGSGSHYTGAEEWWEAPGCERRYSNSATVDISGDTAHLCSKDPFPGPPPSECVDMKRLKSLPPG